MIAADATIWRRTEAGHRVCKRLATEVNLTNTYRGLCGTFHLTSMQDEMVRLEGRRRYWRISLSARNHIKITQKSNITYPSVSDDCQLVTDVGRRHLRSSFVYTCVVQRTQWVTDWRQEFLCSRPRLWNNLPTEIRKRDTRPTFEHYIDDCLRRFVRLCCGAL